MMTLTWHEYRYYPYERELAGRESAALLSGAEFCEAVDGINVIGPFELDAIKRLTYFSGFRTDQSFTPTVQALLETAARDGKNRQATRYSTHGLHEYKGKFNPQVVKALLNIFGVNPGDSVLDPFCGSGTTLVECAHIGVCGFGTDFNPFAVYVTNAKLLALRTPFAQLQLALERIGMAIRNPRNWASEMPDGRRTHYLADWFELPILRTLETVRACVEAEAGPLAPIFLVIASNLLRDYSRQDPNDLRVRRRKTPLPNTPFVEAFLYDAGQALTRLQDTQSQLETGKLPLGMAVVCDATALASHEILGPFDAVITSPPYAMALPYIDTQRLSLVWLGLLDAGHIRELEANLVGSREIRGKERYRVLENRVTNAAALPRREADFCATLQKALGNHDGFRRKAVPNLLYRYFAAMQVAFAEILKVMQPGAPFGMIVGHNHTVLGGVRLDIDTPDHLASLADNAGWHVEELMPLQSYQRYGYHMNNAISSESLIILRA